MPRVGVIGATGLVGTEMLRVLEERAFPVDELRVFASPRSEGRKLSFAGREVACQVMREGCFDGLDFVIVDVDDPLALECAPAAAAAGAKVVDNSAAFRMDPDVPLVVAEINPEDLRSMPQGHRLVPQLHDDGAGHGPGAAAPRRRARAHGRVDVPVGVGSRCRRHARARRAVDEGRGPSRPAAARRRDRRGDRARATSGTGRSPATSSRWRARCGRRATRPRRWKLVNESRKILHAPDLAVSVTCVRVPVYVGHAMTANLRFRRPVTPDEAVELLTDAPGVQLADGGAGHPTPLESAGIDPVLVGRIREDPSEPGQPQPVGDGRQPAQGRRPQLGPAGRTPPATAEKTGQPAHFSTGFGR